MSKESNLTEAQTGIGKLIVGGARRDAIHFAVTPIVAAHQLPIGSNVGIDEEGKATRDIVYPHVGIVDPFLKDHVQTGEKFWMFLYPNTITTLRHVWEHPSFPNEGESVPIPVSVPVLEEVPPVSTAHPVDKAASEAWLRNFIDRSDCPDYDTVIDTIMNGDSWDSDYLHFSEDASGEIPDEFWDHIEVITGLKWTARAKYFSCSC
jgi:hypothetical protein